MPKEFFTAQNLTKLGDYPRLAYIQKLNVITADGPVAGKKKSFSIPMGFKWGFFSYFDSAFSIDNANLIATACLLSVPWLIEKAIGCKSDERPMLWFVEGSRRFVFSAFSWPEGQEPQPEEMQNMMRFNLFDAYYYPDASLDLWANKNQFTAPSRGGGARSGNGPTGSVFLPSTLPVIPNKSRFKAAKSSFASSISFFNITYLFESIAEAFEIDPYTEVDTKAFKSFFPHHEQLDVEQLFVELR